jgi:GNAT superfamily N-acetyltransferase
MSASSDVAVIDVTDPGSFERVPPCANPTFDHRTCDYWEDEVRGSKAHRASWLQGSGPTAGASPASRVAANPFAPSGGPAFNPFAPAGTSSGGASPGARVRANPFGDDADEEIENPFAPRPATKPAVALDAPRKLQLLGRGLAVLGSYAKVLEVDGAPAAYCQFGPLSAYPRARRVRELYPRLPVSPLPAVITCIATTAEARRRGLARQLVDMVADDLAGRGFSAIETYPEPEPDPDATSAATAAFWLSCGFTVAVDDARFPVMRREL